jgi:beta-lactamase class A
VDKGEEMGGLMLTGLLLFSSAWAKTESRWVGKFRKEMKLLEAEYPGRIGVHVMDLRRGDTFGMRASEKWYLASGIKLPVAIETFRQVEAGNLSLDDKVTLNEESYVDGAGTLNYAQPGTQHTVRHLLEQMMILSDNTATDLLIGKIGIENVNALAKKNKFAAITTLADVRRKIYGHLHPSGARLKSHDYLLLHKAPTDEERAALFEKMIKVPPAQWNAAGVEKAYAAYYAEGLNAATLENYSALMEKVWAGDLLKATSVRTLTEIMGRCKTGEQRIKAQVPEGFVFAHKTGTQRKRVCDFGVVRDTAGNNVALISACTRGFATAEAETVLNAVSAALTKSGIYNLGPDLAE